MQLRPVFQSWDFGIELTESWDPGINPEFETHTVLLSACSAIMLLNSMNS